MQCFELGWNTKLASEVWLVEFWGSYLHDLSINMKSLAVKRNKFTNNMVLWEKFEAKQVNRVVKIEAL